MEITTSQDGTIEIRKVFNSITLITDKGERISICMRDSGFEFMYKDVWYSAKEGKVKKMSEQERIKFPDTEVTNQVLVHNELWKAEVVLKASVCQSESGLFKFTLDGIPKTSVIGKIEFYRKSKQECLNSLNMLEVFDATFTKVKNQ